MTQQTKTYMNMNKFTSLALAALIAAPAVSVAQEIHTDTIKSKSDFTNAISAIGAGQAGKTFELVLAWGGDQTINVGNIKPNMINGRLYIHSLETDYDKMPKIQLGFDWAKGGSDTDRLSIIFENVNLQYRSGAEASSGQIVYLNKKDIVVDTIAFRNCDINNYPRSIVRTVPSSSSAVKRCDWVEVSNCLIHDACRVSGNNWAAVYMGHDVNHVRICNNMVYDLPLSKGIYLMGYSDGNGNKGDIVFNNNVVIAGNTNQGNKFVCINVGTKMDAEANFFVNNNAFLAPQAGKYTLLNDTTTYVGGTEIFDASAQGYLTAANNVIDTQTWQSLQAKMDANNGTEYEGLILGNLNWAPDELDMKEIQAANAGFTSWEEGVVFQDPANSQYWMKKSMAAYTMGKKIDPITFLPTDETCPIGAEWMYVDAFPVKAKVNISIDGPKYITYTVSPEKATYYVGDEITLTLRDHNSYYRTFNTFKGWSDGSMEKTRVITLDGDLNLAAQYEADANVLAAFDFSGVTKNGSPADYSADIFYKDDPTYQAKVSCFVPNYASETTKDENDKDVTTYSLPENPEYVAGTFESRPAKFGEDAEEMQMPILSLRTKACAKKTMLHEAIFEVCTKNMTDIFVTLKTGCDNQAVKTKTLAYSLDGQSYTQFATADIEIGKWADLEGKLPAEAENQEKVYIRLVGDVASDYIWTTAAGQFVDETGAVLQDKLDAGDSFEYFGNVLITADTTLGISEIAADRNAAADANAPVYNVMGMRVNRTATGLLIQNGKKFIRK